MDDNGNQVLEDQKSQWRAIAELRRGQLLQQQEIAVIKEQQVYQNEKHDRMIALMESVDRRTTEMQQEYHRMSGGLAVAKWFAGIMAGVSGACVALYVWFQTR